MSIQITFDKAIVQGSILLEFVLSLVTPASSYDMDR